MHQRTIIILFAFSATFYTFTYAQCVSSTDAFEPNDSFYDATQVNMPFFAGDLTLCNPNDTADWFAFPVGGNTGTLNIVARWNQTVNYLDFTIWTPQQTQASSYSSQLLRTDTEFIQIDLSNRTQSSMGGWWVGVLPKDTSQAGTYSLSISWSPYHSCQSDNFEPNDDFATATVVSGTSFAASGLSMCNSRQATQDVVDQDFFRIQPQDDLTSLTVQIGFYLNNFNLTLYDSNGAALVEADQSVAFVRKLEKVPLLANTTYFIGVREVDGERVFPHAPSYSFNLSIVPRQADSSSTPSTFTSASTSISSSMATDLQNIVANSSSSLAGLSVLGLGVGIGVGVFILAGAIFGAFFILRRHKRRKNSQNDVLPRRSSYVLSEPTPVPQIVVDRGAGTLPPGTSAIGSSTMCLPTVSAPISVPVPVAMPVATENSFLPGSPPSSPKSEEIFRIDFRSLAPLTPVGQGSHGIVYKGKWRAMDVAVKQMNEEIAQDEKALSDFYREAELLSKLRPHPNVILFIGVTQRPLAIVTEFCSGGSLFDLICEGRSFSISQIKIFLLGVARGMLHLHAEGIIHRDLAARNVLLTEKLDPKISDFGLSRESGADGEEARRTLTLTGPLRWMSPESIRDRVYSRESDVWAFGIVVWELITRETPYQDLEAVNAAIGVGFQGLRLEIPKCDPQLESIMQGCWMEDVGMRPTFEEICVRLEGEEAIERPRGRSFSQRTFEYGCMTPDQTRASPAVSFSSHRTYGSDETQEIPPSFRDEGSFY